MGSSTHFDFASFFISIGTGIVWTVLGTVMYRLLYQLIWVPLLIGLIFLGLAITTFLTIILCNKIHKGTAYSNAFSVKTVLIIIAIFGAGILFEYLYELEPGKAKVREASGYAFLIDDSGSMLDSDPENKRVDAIVEVLSDRKKNFPFVVYRYGTDVERLTDVMPASQVNEKDLQFNSDGLTYTFTALEKILSDINSREVDLGDNPMILHFSDGMAMDLESYQPVVDGLKARGIKVISVGTIGADMVLLDSVSKETGGVSMSIDNVSELPATMKLAIQMANRPDRDLLGPRTRKHDLLHILMRIGFLMIIGGLFVLLKVQCFFTRDRNNVALAFMIALVAVSSLVMEFGIRYLPHLFQIALMGFLFICFNLIFGGDRSCDLKQNANGGFGNYNGTGFGGPGGAGYGGGYGGYNNGGYNNGGYNNGGYNNGGYNNGSYNNGGYSNGGYNNGRF